MSLGSVFVLRQDHGVEAWSLDHRLRPTESGRSRDPVRTATWTVGHLTSVWCSWVLHHMLLEDFTPGSLELIYRQVCYASDFYCLY